MKTLAALVLVLLLSQLAGAQTVSGSIILKADATDVTPAVDDIECGVASVQFFNGVTPLGPALTTPTSGTSYELTLDTKTIPNGTYVITAKATDRAGLNGACDSTAVNIGVSNAVTIVINNTKDTDTKSISISVSVP